MSDTAAAADAAPAVEAGGAAASALADSIKKKGAMSYYAAHKTDHGLAERPVVYDEPPRLLSSSASAAATGGAAAAGATAVAAKAPPRVAISSYSWSDEKANVKVRVEHAGASLLPDGAVSVSCTDISFHLTIETPGETRALRLGPLHGEIAGATAKRYANKVVVTLAKKAPDAAWWSLLKASGGGVDDDAGGSGAASGLAAGLGLEE